MPAEQDQAARLFAALPGKTLSVQEHLTLAVMVAAKWDRAYDRYGAAPRPGEVASCDTFTEREMSEHRDSALRMMRGYAAGVARARTPWIMPVLQGVTASFIYTLLLILAALVLKYNGIDFIGIAEAVMKRG